MKRNLDNIIRENKVLSYYNNKYNIFDMKEDTLIEYIMILNKCTFINISRNWYNISKLSEDEFKEMMKRLGGE